LSVCVSAFYFPITLPPAQVPSEIILSALKKKALSKKEIVALFDQKVLVGKRIETLKTAGLLYEQDNYVIQATEKGRIIGFFVVLIQNFFGMS
jgi:hypothetical protein